LSEPMPGLIKDKALGLIETVGLVGAIEACDAAAKAADVVISAAEVVDPGLVTLKIFGELGAVQAAVEAGARAAERVGQLLGKHVIPNPDDNLDVIMGGKYIQRGPVTHAGKSGPPKSRQKGHNEQGIESGKFDERDLAQVEKLPVSQLRQFARTIPNLTIKGRDISKADKVTLLKEIRAALGRD